MDEITIVFAVLAAIATFAIATGAIGHDAHRLDYVAPLAAGRARRRALMPEVWADRGKPDDTIRRDVLHWSDQREEVVQHMIDNCYGALEVVGR